MLRGGKDAGKRRSITKLKEFKFVGRIPTYLPFFVDRVFM
jgi:hypothetical protein